MRARRARRAKDWLANCVRWAAPTLTDAEEAWAGESLFERCDSDDERIVDVLSPFFSSDIIPTSPKMFGGMR